MDKSIIREMSKTFSDKSLRKKIGKIFKWGKNFVRILKYKILYGERFQCQLFSSKPTYIGRNCKVKIEKDGMIVLASGVYLDDYCLLEASGGKIEISENVYFNTFSRVIAKNEVRKIVK